MPLEIITCTAFPHVYYKIERNDEESDKWKNKSKKVTKRQILSATSSIYDPLGLVTPITVKAKMILRKTWATSPKIGWDDKVLKYHMSD